MSDVQGSNPEVEKVADIDEDSLVWKQYSGEHELQLVTDLIDKELSEPYSIFTYRYFINQWPQLCFLVCVKANWEVLGFTKYALDIRLKRTRFCVVKWSRAAHRL